MLKPPTKTPKAKRSKDAVRVRITAKKSVDSPIIRASVPAIDKRSFQILIFYPISSS
jgi:hypothetical protein